MKKLLKGLGYGLAALVVLAGVGFGAASLKTRARLAHRYTSHSVELKATGPLGEAIARGKHLVEGRYGCSDCHGGDLAGGTMVNDAAIGKLLGPNITGGKGGRTASYRDQDWDRIVRHGIKPDGTPAVMPSGDFFKMTDRELADIVAYVQSKPHIDRVVPAPSFGPLGTLLVALGKFPLSAEKKSSHFEPHAAQAPESSDTAEFGEHLAAVCSTCHQGNLAGGPMRFGPPDWPAAGNLTPHATGLASWSFADFERAVTQGVSKSGRPLREPMAAVLATTRNMTDVERRALWRYLQTLPALAPNP